MLKNVCNLQVPNIVFLAVSPEEKESWVNALNLAIIKAKNRIFDEVWVAYWLTFMHKMDTGGWLLDRWFVK